MTEKTEKVVFENPDGEICDVYGAFDRHAALTGRNADTDISVELNPSYELEFTIRVGAGTMARLVQILNAAPRQTERHTMRKPDAIPRKDDKPEIITYVTLTLNTSVEGAYYIAELISQLSEENG